MSRMNRDGINDGTAEPGREDQEARMRSDRLRIAIDSLERAVLALGAACRKAEEYIKQRGSMTQENEQRTSRGMIRY